MAHVTQFIIKSAGDEVTTESNFRRAEESIAGAWDSFVLTVGANAYHFYDLSVDDLVAISNALAVHAQEKAAREAVAENEAEYEKVVSAGGED